jgi:hypothetical protein
MKCVANQWVIKQNGKCDERRSRTEREKYTGMRIRGMGRSGCTHQFVGVSREIIYGGVSGVLGVDVLLVLLLVSMEVSTWGRRCVRLETNVDGQVSDCLLMMDDGLVSGHNWIMPGVMAPGRALVESAKDLQNEIPTQRHLKWRDWNQSVNLHNLNNN